MTTTDELFQQGRLTEALAAQVALVKAKPSDVQARGLLVELLCLTGQLERADAQLETVLAQSPEHIHGAALVRQLIRADQARRDFWSAGRVPEFTATPSERLKLILEASIRLREKAFADATRLLLAAEEARSAVAGTHDGQPFDDLRELDDRLGSVLEVLTPTGKYFWIDFSELETLAFDAPERPLDLLWRRATIDVRSGPQGAVYVPAIYASAAENNDTNDAHRLGRATDWIECGAGGPVRGVGQRTWLIGDADVPLMQVGSLEFGASRG